MDPNVPVQPVDDEQPTERVAPAESVESTQPVAPAHRARYGTYRRDVVQTTGASPAFRAAQVVYVICGLIVALIIIRVILKALAANASAGFTSFVYGITAPLVAPFQGIFNTPQTGNGSVFEFSSVVAIVVYALIAWALVRLIDSMGPQRTPPPTTQ